MPFPLERKIAIARDAEWTHAREDARVPTASEERLRSADSRALGDHSARDRLTLAPPKKETAAAHALDAPVAASKISTLSVSAPRETLASPLATHLRDLRLRADGTRLRDSEGRQVMLRGVNAGGHSKWAPYFPFPFAESGRADQKEAPAFDAACAAYLDGAAALGHNFLRLPFVWEAVEPERGHFDETYLARFEKMIDLAGARGMRVLLDAHQDLFGRAYGGDGFPRWALSRPEAKQPAYGHVLWSLGYAFDRNVRNDLTGFWHNQDGLQDRFTAMWRMMAARFGTKSNVVSFEIFNEPAPGREPAKAWARETLTEFHSRLGAEIRSVAPHALVAFGVSGLDGLRAKTDTQKPQGESWMFAPHYYDGKRVTLSLLHASAFSPLLGKFSAVTPLGRWAKSGKAWHVPVVVGEFGIPRNAHGSAAYLRANYDALDAHLLSGAAWEYSTTHDDWNHEGMSLTLPGGGATSSSIAATRPFPAAIAGTLHQFNWDASRSQGSVAFTAVAGQTSDIALPQTLVGAGQVTMRSRGSAALSWRYENGHLRVRADKGGHAIVYFAIAPAQRPLSP